MRKLRRARVGDMVEVVLDAVPEGDDYVILVRGVVAPGSALFAQQPGTVRNVMRVVLGEDRPLRALIVRHREDRTEVTRQPGEDGLA